MAPAGLVEALEEMQTMGLEYPLASQQLTESSGKAGLLEHYASKNSTSTGGGKPMGTAGVGFL